MALKAGYKGFKTLGPGLDYDSVTGHLFLNGESDISLDNLKDVSIDTPVDGDILIYDSTTETWYNEQIDSDPVEDSSKPVSSGGVYAAVASRVDWDSYAKTGVHNLQELDIPSQTLVGTYTLNDDETITCSGTLSARENYYVDRGTDGQRKAIPSFWYGKKLRISCGFIIDFGKFEYGVHFYDSSNQRVINADIENGKDYIEVLLPANSTAVTYDAYYVFNRDALSLSLDGKVLKPLITFAEDTSMEHEPFALSNYLLTQMHKVKSLPIVWNPALNLDSNKGATITQYGKMYLISFWFKATTDTTGAIGIIKIPNNNISVGNYVIAEDNDKARWGGRILIGSDYYVSIGGDLTTGKTYRAQVVGIDQS